MLKIYLISLTILLSIVCLLTTATTYKIINRHIYTNNNFKYEKSKAQEDTVLKLVQIYMKQKRWLSCILILEKNIKDKSKLIINFYNSIGFCYYYLKIYSLSEYFYEQAIRKKNNDTTILCNLAQVYTKNNKYQQAIKIYQAVLRLESNNKVAQQQLDKLTT